MQSHYPRHLYLDLTWYMLTAATAGHMPLLHSENIKCYLRDGLKELAQKYQVKLLAWVILDDHYHLILRTNQGAHLPRFIGQLHGRTARHINLANGITDHRVWKNYWDACIRAEADLWPRFNYIHSNPVKHGYVSRPDDWPFSSYHFYLRTRGAQWLGDCRAQYPVIDQVDGDNFNRQHNPH